MIAEATAAQREREDYAPPEPERTSTQAIDVLTRAMRRCEAESLALHQQLVGAELPAGVPSGLSETPLSEFAEAGADHAARFTSLQTSPTISSPECSDHYGVRRCARVSGRDASRER